MKKFLAILLMIIGVQSFAGHETKSFLIQFATDQHELDSSAITKLNEVYTCLKGHPNAKVKLTGRTDFDGSIGYNIALSRMRTNEVAEFLKTKGWQKTEINEKWLGELKPIANNANEYGKALNRSVEIVITILNYANTDEWLKEKQVELEESYTLHKSGENFIATDNQTQITIPKDAFVTSEGKHIDNKNVKIVIKEVNTQMDAILNKVYTMAGDKLLETGGMINIEAYNNNSKLELATGKEITVKIPTTMQKSDMLVFEGVTDPAGNVDWKNTGKPFETNVQKERVSNKLNEDILLSLINAIDLKNTADTKFDLAYKLPAFVNVPNKPRMPKTPVKPKAKEVFTFLGWIFSTQKMKDREVEKVYANQMADYAKRLDNYNKRLLRYETTMANQKHQIEKFEADKKLFYNWVFQTRCKVRETMNSIFDNHDKRRIKLELTKLRTKSINGDQYSVQPLKNLKRISSNSNLTYDENERLTYLSNLNLSLTTLYNSDYERIVKKYSRIGKLRMPRFKKSIDANEMSTRLWNNSFFYEFINNNKLAFESVFGTETDQQLINVQNQIQDAKQGETINFFNGSVKFLGWINCDRFVRSQLTNVSFKRMPGAFQVVIVTEINSMLNTSYYTNSNELTYASIPKNEKFKLLTMRVEGDVAYYSIIESIAISGLKLEPVFTKVTLDELDKVLFNL